MNRKSAFLLSAAAGAMFAAADARASDTTTYRYDALGRLIAVTTSGGPNNGQNVGTCYDRAGNRTTYTVNTTGTPPPACPPPPPSPPPAPGSARHFAADRADV